MNSNQRGAIFSKLKQIAPSSISQLTKPPAVPSEKINFLPSGAKLRTAPTTSDLSNDLKTPKPKFGKLRKLIGG
jgi:hypothetical protein